MLGGSTTSWIGIPEVMDKYMLSRLCFEIVMICWATDVVKIMQVMLGTASESDLSDNSVMYLTGLSKDVYFIQFLAGLGKRAMTWAIAKNHGIPPLFSNRDIVTLNRSTRNGTERLLFARTALRMLGSQAANTVNPELIRIMHDVANWLTRHEYVALVE